ncbi:hypothetical protein HYFRA_00001718 [Hymenoscyphus fraxineus]|uniref:Cell wall mannoprotein PIR1-like C-terminal domain-containing protein n=1 Tax=Hymenoscyphus fraxineus TaxID=746836 RepID=A0A9N9PXX7_9HELO|nr:hypothetical protein HYFRA_00001718 [Hymenoscyphus fraxineus]
MHNTFALAALAGVAYALPQGVTETIAPQAAAPGGCSPSISGKFQLEAVNITAPAKVKRDSSCGAEGVLTVDLKDGKLTDSKQRTGYIASNYQFQFDAPPQTGTIYSGGFSACSNGSLALGGSAVFYQCYSGGFYNLYDRSWAEQCNPILLQMFPCGGAPAVGQAGDGQPQATTAVAPVSQIPDGQPQATTALPKPAAPINQIGDGQIQATPAAPAAPISQIGDGQIQAPTVVPQPLAPISQIPDGQPQVPTAAPAPPAPPAPTPNAPINQIGDGQIQATPAASPSAPISQIPDGQVQAGNGSAPAAPSSAPPSPSSAPSPPMVAPVSGASKVFGSQVAAVAIGIFAVAFL